MRLIMRAVTVSPKFQVVIPKEVRESIGIISGQKVQMLTYCNRIELIPIKPMSEMRGFLKGIDTEVPREQDRV
ncbi:AbrB/MazE/SpoVT family DNA-binding domain-containing protein [Methyloprofundus sp.]|uniref:AbrB/MazE/SpoVT family DNA-binding domain-containing protein n=1 Tax=Methyloprofundus sp. TaxID=2020875 RepID=UPI003D11C17D